LYDLVVAKIARKLAYSRTTWRWNFSCLINQNILGFDLYLGLTTMLVILEDLESPPPRFVSRPRVPLRAETPGGGGGG
jgi:hypothetical protein